MIISWSFTFPLFIRSKTYSYRAPKSHLVLKILTRMEWLFLQGLFSLVTNLPRKLLYTSEHFCPLGQKGLGASCFTILSEAASWIKKHSSSSKQEGKYRHTTFLKILCLISLWFPMSCLLSIFSPQILHGTSLWLLLSCLLSLHIPVYCFSHLLTVNGLTTLWSPHWMVSQMVDLM